MSRFLDLAEFGEAALYLRLTNLEHLAAKAQAYDGTKRSWLPDDVEAYVEVEIKELNGDKTTVETKDGRVNMLLVTTNAHDYHFCSQGVTTVEGIDDGEELKLTDPMGILSILEEECMFPKATDNSFKTKLYDNHLGKSPNFLRPRPDKKRKYECHFEVVHYAGVVAYNITGWLDKNRDPLNETVVTLFMKSSHKLMAGLFADYISSDMAGEPNAEGKHKKRRAASFQTVSQLNKAMARGKLMRMAREKMMIERDAVLVIQFNLRAFFSVRTWPWMMLFYKLRPMLRSAQVEKELAVLKEAYNKLKEAFDRSEIKRVEAEERQVILVLEKDDLSLQLQAVSNTEIKRI
ncbi:Myosin-7B [Dissostichus eleginoides]|uniref:Myosin-7B n=1 Tax=Dissostichus eleginoides TaxID=100907 RepID=A0AAD9CE38_DISEL|nr:Myosin-7B [Dissostichus eleginoides]